METYKFPEGTKTLTKEQILEAARKYERLEIPGSVPKVAIDLGKESLPLRELFFHEGVQEISLDEGASEPVSYNIPQSLLKLHGGWCNVKFRAPRVACFPQSVQDAVGFVGVEYLQAYKDSDVRNFRGDDLKHYVYLGKTGSRLTEIFAAVPEGCVIHVENKSMASSTLKKVDVDKVYVIPDALEWKDFPADKLALTMEEYDPESRILPKQIEMREEKRRKEREQQAEERQEQKSKLMTYMAKPILKDALSPLCDTIMVGRADHENTDGEGAIEAHLLFNDILYFSRRTPKPMQFDVVIPLADVVEKSEKAVEIVRRLKDVFYRNQQLMQSLKVGILDCFGFPDDPRPRIHFPFGKKRVIYAFLNWETIDEDSRAMRDFVKELADIIETAKTKEGILIDIKEGPLL